MPRAYRRNGASPGGGVWREPSERYVPPETNNAHVRAWLIFSRNAAPQAQAQRPVRLPACLPPSLAGHRLTGREFKGRHDDDCTRAEATELLELRPTREDTDGDGDGDEQESIPELSPREAAAGDNSGTDAPEPELASDNDCDDAGETGKEEPMAETVSGKIDRLLEIEREQAELADEQQRLLADPQVDGFIQMAKRLGRRLKGVPRPKEAPTSTSSHAPASPPRPPRRRLAEGAA